MIEATPDNWLQVTALAKGREVYLPASRYQSGFITHPLNIRGDGIERTVLAGGKINACGPAVLECRKLAFNGTFLNIRFAEWLSFRDVRFTDATVRIFAGTSILFDRCHFLNTRVIVADAKPGSPASGKVWFHRSEFVFQQWAVYLGYRSRLCAMDRCIFEAKEPDEHAAVVLHPDSESLKRAEHDLAGFKVSSNVHRIAWRQLTTEEQAA
jgi:hypothetical protein